MFFILEINIIRVVVILMGDNNDEWWGYGSSIYLLMKRIEKLDWVEEIYYFKCL